MDGPFLAIILFYVVNMYLFKGNLYLFLLFFLNLDFTILECYHIYRRVFFWHLRFRTCICFFFFSTDMLIFIRIVVTVDVATLCASWSAFFPRLFRCVQVPTSRKCLFLSYAFSLESVLKHRFYLLCFKCSRGMRILVSETLDIK